MTMYTFFSLSKRMNWIAYNGYNGTFIHNIVYTNKVYFKMQNPIIAVVIYFQVLLLIN